MSTNYYIGAKTIKKETYTSIVINRITSSKFENMEYKVTLDKQTSKTELWRAIAKEVAKLNEYHPDRIKVQTTSRLGLFSANNEAARKAMRPGGFIH